MGGAAFCLHCFLVSIWNRGNSPLKDHLVPPVAQKLREDPWLNLGIVTTPLNIGPFYIVLVFLLHWHIFLFPSSCMHFPLGVLLPRLKTLLTSCNPPRGPAFYRPFVKLAAYLRCTVMIPPFLRLWGPEQRGSRKKLVFNSNAALEGSLLGTSKWCSCDLKGPKVLQCQFACPKKFEVAMYVRMLYTFWLLASPSMLTQQRSQMCEHEAWVCWRRYRHKKLKG